MSKPKFTPTNHSKSVILKLASLKNKIKEQIALKAMSKEQIKPSKILLCLKAKILANKKDTKGAKREIKAKFCILILHFFQTF